MGAILIFWAAMSNFGMQMTSVPYSTMDECNQALQVIHEHRRAEKHRSSTDAICLPHSGVGNTNNNLDKQKE
jgi:hypothetical protein